MSYQVLARKWRPRRFEEVVGQEHVLRPLIHALDHNRLHHAYLFTGTRGVGKTTLGRILAKSLNCEQGVSAHPCGLCSACVAIDEGRFVDMLEVDAASRTKVEDTRELLENVQYLPSAGRYKVYLIDEVHMLSNHSFNALLKTLEEPPPHVKFLLATTDPQKLPVTILSRCLRFNLKAIPIGLITQRLQFILQAEAVINEAAALNLLARAAEGSMRDALSLVDQAIAFGGGQVSLEATGNMLGTLDRSQVWDILDALAQRQGGALLAVVQRLTELGVDSGLVLSELLSALHQVAVAQVVPEASSAENDARLHLIATQLSPEDVQLFYQIALLGRRDLPHASDARSALEMTLLRMLAFQPVTGEWSSQSAAMPIAAPATAASARVATPSRVAPATPKTAAPLAQVAPPLAMLPIGEEKSPTYTGDAPDWVNLVGALNLSGMVRELARQCTWCGRDDHKITLSIKPGQANVATALTVERLQKALATYYNTNIKLVIETRDDGAETPAQRGERERRARQQQAEDTIRADPNVRAMQELLGARIEAVRPISDKDEKK
ncbi:MAG: DNA polymerase III subunit gamma/tau [Pseudomonadota bacterium]